MRAWWAAIQAARKRRAVEQTLKGLHARGQMVLAIREQDAYTRIYVPSAIGILMLRPGTAKRHLMALEAREFERALAVR
jgi:hypothetical protein